MKSLYLTIITSLLLIVSVSPLHAQRASDDVITQSEQQALSPDEVMKQLQEGNERFVNGSLTKYDYLAQVEKTSSGQYPQAIILSCLDSRVPVELIFDQGVGDVFVGRVAGNVETAEQVGSYEFGTAVAGSKLIVVLGHTSCGAVKGTIDKYTVAKFGHSNLNALIEEINPAVISVLKDGEERSSKNADLVQRSVVENVHHTIEDIRNQSNTLTRLENEGSIKIVGGVYDINTGKVNWLK